jgi:hypothetical protein
LRGLVYLWEGTHEPLAIKREQLGPRKRQTGTSAPFKHLRNWTLRMMFRVHEGLDPTSAINIRHDSLCDRELAPAIGARKPATAFAARLRVVDMPRAMPPGDLIRCSGKMAGVQAKDSLILNSPSRPAA